MSFIDAMFEEMFNKSRKSNLQPQTLEDYVVLELGTLSSNFFETFNVSICVQAEIAGDVTYKELDFEFYKSVANDVREKGVYALSEIKSMKHGAKNHFVDEKNSYLSEAKSKLNGNFNWGFTNFDQFWKLNGRKIGRMSESEMDAVGDVISEYIYNCDLITKLNRIYQEKLDDKALVASDVIKRADRVTELMNYVGEIQDKQFEQDEKTIDDFLINILHKNNSFADARIKLRVKKEEIESVDDALCSKANNFVYEKLDKSAEKTLISKGLSRKHAKRLANKMDDVLLFMDSIQGLFVEAEILESEVKKLYDNCSQIFFLENGSRQEYLSALKNLFDRYEKIPSGILPSIAKKKLSSKDSIESLLPNNTVPYGIFGLDLIPDEAKCYFVELIKQDAFSGKPIRKFENMPGKVKSRMYVECEKQYGSGHFRKLGRGQQRVVVQVKTENGNTGVFVKSYDSTHKDYEIRYNMNR